MENRCLLPADRWVQVSDALLSELVSASRSPAPPSPSEKQTPPAHRNIKLTCLAVPKSRLQSVDDSEDHWPSPPKGIHVFVLCCFYPGKFGTRLERKKRMKRQKCVCVCVCMHVYTCTHVHACRNMESVEEGVSSLGQAKQMGVSILRLCWHCFFFFFLALF